eukprot:Gb_04649 [translate_table: standard]
MVPLSEVYRRGKLVSLDSNTDYYDDASADSQPTLVFFFSTYYIFLIFFAFLNGAQPHHHTTFFFNNFNATGSNLTLIKDASFVSNVIRLTNHSQRLIGRALYSNPVQIKNNKTVLSFSTTFVFSIVTPSPGPGGHGLSFIMTPYKSLMGALPSDYLGLLNSSSRDGQGSNHLFAVEFDTNTASEFSDINDNHVGVDINSLNSTNSTTAGYWTGKQFQELSLKSGKNIQAWIEYDHLLKQLNVTITLAGSPRPVRPLISLPNLDLSTVLQEKMYVGFCAATGTLVEHHYILAWSFTTNGMALPLDLSLLPSFAHKNPKHHSKGFIVGITAASLLLLMVTGLAIFCWFKRMKYRECIEEWEREFWPHRLPYRELSIATYGFKEEQLLGSGGFGKVYKGVLPSNGLEIAVKCIIKDSTEGMKEFIAEISSVGRLQHRNLVQLRGWCRRNNQLFVVYEYMPNGSLDRLIFGKPKIVLRWPERYKILKGVAAGLLYLHEQWDRRVVHRDVKSSNILIDSELNAKLGDFGLARLYDHDQNSETTRVVGTLGYIAPEFTQTGKATPSTDVFSFGIVLLEVACGRKPIDPFKDAEEVVLVECVRELFAKDKLMDAADPKLDGEYDAEEMERVLKLGLICSHPHPEGRLSIRHVLQILEGEVPLPVMHIPSSSLNNMGSNRRIGNFGNKSESAEPCGSSSKSYTADELSTSSSKGKSKVLM